jgi:hypothetical protein
VFLFHPGDGFVAAAQAIAGDAGVVVGGEVGGVGLELACDAVEAHCVVEGWITLEAAGERGDDLGHAFGFVGRGVSIPETGGER